MSRRIELRPHAAEELEHTIDWYEGERQGLGDRFLRAVTTTLTRVAENPRLGSAWSRDPETRRWVLKRFPYVVFLSGH